MILIILKWKIWNHQDSFKSWPSINNDQQDKRNLGQRGVQEPNGDSTEELQKSSAEIGELPGRMTTSGALIGLYGREAAKTKRQTTAHCLPLCI